MENTCGCVLGLWPWPRECLSSERLSLALASDFFCVLSLGLGLEPYVLDSTSGSKYKERIKFDKIWGYQKKGIPLKQGRQNSNFNHLRWTDEIFRKGKYEGEMKFDKNWGTTMVSPSQTRTLNSNFLIV